jgi:hypothetical protein
LKTGSQEKDYCPITLKECSIGGREIESNKRFAFNKNFLESMNSPLEGTGLPMSSSWESFLDIIGLQQTERSCAHLKTLADFPAGYPEKSRLLALLEQTEQIYGNEEFAVVWLNNGSRIYKKIANKQDWEKIACLWQRIAGNYMLFLPRDANIEKGLVQDEEQFIGQCLEKHKQLVLKTEDAYVVLHLQLT